MARSRKQLSLFGDKVPEGQSHGGSLRAGKRKLMRPIVTKSPMHVVLRSTRAKGHWSMLYAQNKMKIESILRKLERKYHIKIFARSNMGNHIHLLIQGRSRDHIQNFLRVFSALVARAITGAKKGKPVGKFWDSLVFTRIVRWGKDFQNTLKYTIANTWEGLGILKRSSGCSTVFLFDELAKKGAMWGLG